MIADDREALEQRVRVECERGDYATAATLALESYGPEILGFLAAFLRNDDDAAEVFSTVCENLWRGLPAFAWASTLRTWAYAIARHAAIAFRKGAQRLARHAVPLDTPGAVSAVAERVRTRTRPYMLTEQKDRFALLRASLPEEDQMLLMLRIDRDLAWSDLARVMTEGDALDDEALKREAARLRKRFQLVKEKLVELGVKEGLIPKPE
jgi:RNA polymerase sigma-70 factor (ECF subfamily)